MELNLVSLLPPDLAWLIFIHVPVDQRLMLRAVCASWRGALAEPTLWRELDFTIGDLQIPRRRGLLHAAVLCAKGKLRQLVLPCKEMIEDLAFAYANSGSLRSLRIGCPALPCCLLDKGSVDALLSAAPRLETLECGVCGTPEEMLSVLSNKVTPDEGVYRALRVNHAWVGQSFAARRAAANVLLLAEAIAGHDGLQKMTVDFVEIGVTQLEALIDAAARRQLIELSFTFCRLTPAHLQQLSRSLEVRELRKLSVWNYGEALVGGDRVHAFCSALKACSLKEISLKRIGLFDSLSDGLSVLDALAGHHSIARVDLYFNSVALPFRVAVGEALGRIVVAESALESLALDFCALGDEGARPFFDAVAKSATLSYLACGENRISRACACETILPAVRANESLRKLTFMQSDVPELGEAECIVETRQASEAGRQRRFATFGERSTS